MNLARKLLILLTLLFAIGSLFGFLSATRSDSEGFYLLLLGMCIPGLIGVAIFFVRSRLQNPSARLLAQLVAASFCFITIGLNLQVYYGLASIPAMLAKEGQLIRDENTRKQVYIFEEADFNSELKKIVRWTTPGDRSQFIELLYLITISDQMILIAKKEKDFLPQAQLFNGEKITQVTVNFSNAREDAFSTVGSFVLDGVSYSFNHSMSKIGYGYDIEPAAPLMFSLFPQKI
jgi:hypothetical protein